MDTNNAKHYSARGHAYIFKNDNEVESGIVSSVLIIFTLYMLLFEQFLKSHSEHLYFIFKLVKSFGFLINKNNRLLLY